MSKSIYFSYILEESDKFKSLSDDKKFSLLIEMIKRGTISSLEMLNKALAQLGWDQRNFLDTFKELWDSKKIGWNELDVLDSNDHLFKGPGFLSNRWLVWNIGQKSLCDRIPSKNWDELPYCKDYKDSQGL